MKVILLKDVPGTGKAGTVAEVSEGHARNYLIPRYLAVEATPGALRHLEHQKQMMRRRAERERDAVTAQMQRLEGLVLEIRAKAGEGGRLFGAVTSQQIAKALEARGFAVTRKQVELDDPIKVEGFYRVPIRLRPGVVVRVDLNVTGAR
ncbi:MAG: 50S ribosomal protein L9 [Armatimonadetes bacterium]|nr:50S ribosomal protein L9 [Armatimonadota bacterium]